MARTSTLLKRLQPMLATLTDAPFDDKGWIFEDKYDGFRMIAKIEDGGVILYSRNGKIISHNYIEVAKALEGVKGDAVIDGELVALDQDGVSHFQLLQNALRSKAKLQYCAFDLMFQDGEDKRLTLLERKKRLNEILPRHKLIAFSRHRKQAAGVLRGGRAKRPRRHHGQAGGQQVSVRRAYRQLAEDQDVEAAGSRDRRFHRRGVRGRSLVLLPWPCGKATAGATSAMSARALAMTSSKSCMAN